MPKSRLGNPFNPLQRYAFEFYMTSLLLIFLRVCSYVCIRELFFLLVFQQVEPDDLLVARHVVGQVDQPYHRRRPRQANRPYVQPVHRVLHEPEDVLHVALHCAIFIISFLYILQIE